MNPDDLARVEAVPVLRSHGTEGRAMTDHTYTDKCGHVISREEAIEAATRCMLAQGDAWEVVREHMEGLPDPELMEWLVYPDTGEFAHLPEHRV